MDESGWPLDLPRLPIANDWDTCETCDHYWNHSNGGWVGQDQDFCGACRDTDSVYSALTAGQSERLRQVIASGIRCPSYKLLTSQTALDAAGWAGPLRVLAQAACRLPEEPGEAPGRR